MTKAAARGNAPAKPKARPHRPLWRRFNRHKVFALHIILYIVGSTLIWSLNSSVPDKQFDTLVWLAVVCVHGIVIYRQTRAVFLLHLLMFSAGNAAIWSTTAQTPDKLSLNLGWGVIAVLIGVFLFRNYMRVRPPVQRTVKPAKPKAPPKAPSKAPAPPAPVYEAYEDDVYSEPVYDDVAYGDEEQPYYEEDAWYEHPVEEDEFPDEPPPPPKKRGKRNDG